MGLCRQTCKNGGGGAPSHGSEQLFGFVDGYFKEVLRKEGEIESGSQSERIHARRQAKELSVNYNRRI